MVLYKAKEFCWCLLRSWVLQPLRVFLRVFSGDNIFTISIVRSIDLTYTLLVWTQQQTFCLAFIFLPLKIK